ncbi:MAG: hypothetical protein ACFHVJ_13095 [Aestuariibacter sp.]
MEFKALWQVRFLFGFYAVGFLLLSLTFIGLYGHVLKLHEELNLTAAELKETRTEVLVWFAAGIVSVLALVLCLVVPGNYIGFTGFSYFLLFPINYTMRSALNKWAEQEA